jgi:Reverse transcriptase (RNA-dependent DNA polymerase)
LFLLAIDDGDLSALVLLDLSAAFDTVDHCILLPRLDITYRLNGTVLNWFESYLVGRRQQVRIGSSLSLLRTMFCGVPHGSVLGPILFVLYTSELLLLIESHGLRPHLYADDTQMYELCAPKETLSLQIRLSACIDHVAEWMRSNRLQLNAAKTEVLW